MVRKTFFVLAAGLLLLLTACTGQEAPPQAEEPESRTVALTVWGAQEDEELLRELFASFQKQYAGQADFEITYQAQSESGCKDALLADLEGGPDVFAFADDQLAALAAAGALAPIEDAEGLRSANLPAAVEAARSEERRVGKEC